MIGKGLKDDADTSHRSRDKSKSRLITIIDLILTTKCLSNGAARAQGEWANCDNIGHKTMFDVNCGDTLAFSKRVFIRLRCHKERTKKCAFGVENRSRLLRNSCYLWVFGLISLFYIMLPQYRRKMLIYAGERERPITERNIRHAIFREYWRRACSYTLLFNIIIK